MFVQIKKSGGAEYIYVIESYRKGNGSIAHRTVKRLGRLDQFVKDDPEALEKLRVQVRENSNELRNFRTTTAVNQIRRVAMKKEQQGFIDGMPTLNYAAFLIKTVWNGCLKLDYRLNYLQHRYHNAVEFDFDRSVFNLVIRDILSFENTGLKFGTETGLLGSDYNPMEPLPHQQEIFDLLADEHLRILSFIATRLSNDFGIDPESLIPEGFDLQKYRDLLNDKRLPDVSYGPLMLELITAAVVGVLEKKLADAGITTDFNEIRNSLRRAVLLIDYPVAGEGEVLYIKANNGHYVRTMNDMMKAMGLMPLLNIQDRVELSRRLRSKFNTDAQVIPRALFETLNASQKAELSSYCRS